jgi:hypothetical protein
MKDMYRAQTRLTRAAQIFNRILDQYGTPGMNALMG